MKKKKKKVRQSQQTTFNESNETVILEVGKEFTYLCIYLCMSLLLIEKSSLIYVFIITYNYLFMYFFFNQKKKKEKKKKKTIAPPRK